MTDAKHPAEVLADETEQAADAYDLPGVKRAADMLRRIPALEAERDSAIQAARHEADLAQQAIQDMRAAVAERDALKETLHDELTENLALRELGGAGQDEGMTQFLRRVVAERDRLLADIRLIAGTDPTDAMLDPGRAARIAKAAIAATEQMCMPIVVHADAPSWLPISTAPDQEDIEILGWDGNVMDKTWIGWHEDGKPVYLHSDSIAWSPTHWMRLPSSPTAVAGNRLSGGRPG